MRLLRKVVAGLLISTVLIAPSIGAKEGVKATLLSAIPAAIVEGSSINLVWKLEVEKTGAPFSACGVFVRLIGPTNESTESIAGCGARPKGRYSVITTIPRGGVARIEIGIAGTMTDRDGYSERSDWLFPVAFAVRE